MIRKVLDNGVEWLCLVLMVVLAFDLMLGRGLALRPVPHVHLVR